MDMRLIFLMLILLTRFYQRGSLVSGGGQWADHFVANGQQVDQHLKERLMGPGICLGDGQSEALGVPAESGHSDTLLRRMLPYLT